MTEIDPRPEPRGMTLPDVMMLSVGVAVGFAIARAATIFPGFLPGMIPSWGYFLVFALMADWGLATGVTAVALARTARYRRSVRPGEWLALVLTAVGAAALHDGRSDPFESALVQNHGWSFDQARWVVAGGWTLIVGSGLVVQSRIRRPGLGWLHASVGLVLLTLAVRGPIFQFASHGAFLLAPTGGFSQGPGGLLLIQVLERLAATPLGLLVAFPAVATWRALRVRAMGPWTAWIGPILALPPLGYELLFRPTFFASGTTLWAADRGFCLAWTAVEWGLAASVLRFRAGQRSESGSGSSVAT